ncbi:ExeM/NucH family extracellular endonuclease [Cellulosimicrobium marinum]|uniref:ExeM/NucH family extracellular endonuclease n=1 Tax=Cellulosimicrobium marinum TaxID=1638992 RepID=UPI001E506E1A|nr:ExeM/NucH family extracellular endonuclease [Cellulosimicrobium marinum]MCB7135184.1 ExeM/NucH family extracellular endonuclease [Cellulosimicrobium marinum]
MSDHQHLRRRRVVASGLTLALAVPLSVTAATAASAAPDGSGVVINEAYLSGGSANAPFTNKFVELYNPTSADVALDGWSVQYRSATGSAAFSGVVPLSGSIEAGGYYLVQAASNGSNGAALPTPDASGTVSFQGQNGTIALASTTTALNPGTGDLAGTAGVVDLVGYGSSNSFETAAAPAGRANTAGGSLNRAGFADTDDNSADFAVLDAVTPQNSGDDGGPDPEPGEVVPIAEIQGTGAASPLVGQTVTTRGVVTASYPTGGYDGFYLQTEGTGDLADDHDASDAIFVYSAAAAAGVEAGDHVEVTGPVSEYFSMTQIAPAAGGWTVLDEPAEAVKPADVAFPASDAEREALEGMLLQPAGDYTVADNYDTNFYGSFLLAAGTDPFLQPTSAGRPGSAEAAAAVADRAARGVVLDDGATTNFNSTANKAIPLPYLTGGAPARVGAGVTFETPVILDYRFDAWTFQPLTHLRAGDGGNADEVQPATFADTREAAPAAVGGDLSVATFNVLNYFTTTGDQLAGCQFYTDREGNPITVRTGCAARGAADAENLERQQTKIVAAIDALDADVVALMEIENSAPFGKDRDQALSDLVDALNDAAGADEWAFVPSPAALPDDEDVIRLAYIYQVDAAEPVGGSQILLDDAAFVNAREPLAQVFQPAGGADGAEDDVLVVANHFKSKGSGTPVLDGDEDSGDGQGAFNASRVAQAEALVGFAEDVAADAGTDTVLLAGDFNSYSQEDPLEVFKEAGYVDLGATTGEQTYLFDGYVGSLDHVFASPAAADAVTGTDVWNINSVEPIANEYSRYNYNASILYDETAFRSSDHDPVLVGLDLAGDVEPGTTTIDLLAINDFHGRIEPYSTNSTTGVVTNNTLSFAGTVEELRAQNPDGTAFVSAGDNIGASLFASALQQDQPTIDVLNALDLATSAVGNHEFDQGFDDLTGRVADAADWTYTGANVYDKGTQDPALPEYQVVEIDGIDVGFVGVVTEETPTLVTPAGIADLDFGDPVEALNRVTAQLQDGDDANGEADVVVALVHEGAGAGTPDGSTLEEEVAAGGPFAELVTETDPRVAAFFTGHTHKQYAWEAPVPGVEGATRPIVQTGSYGEFVGHITLTIDDETHEVVDHAAVNVRRTTTPWEQLVETYPRVQAVKDVLDPALAEAEVIGSQPVGEVTADITTAYTGGAYTGPGGTYVGPGPQPSSGRDDRMSESTLGNLVANSLRDTLADPDRGGADLGVVNPGGLRNELFYGPDGVVTFAEANAVLPFVNNLWTVTLTGEQVVEMLEQQWQTLPNGTRPSRPYLALGLSDNVSWTAATADGNAAPGDNVLSVTIDGEPVDPAGEYRVATFSFLATGGDNFRVFTQGTNPRDSGLVDRDAWIAYLEENSPLTPSFARSRVVVGALPGPVTAGEDVSVELSALDLTSLGSPRNTEVTGYLVPADGTFDPENPGDAVATATATDGAATLTATVPEDTAEGAYDLWVVASPSGTVSRVPVTVEAAEEPTGVDVAVTAQARCLAGTAYLAVRATNGEDVRIDVRHYTPFGEKRFAGVQPGSSAYQAYNSRQSSIEGGSVTVAGYVSGATPRYEQHRVTYEGITCG